MTMTSLMVGLVVHLCVRERDYQAQVACREHEAQLRQGETNT